MILWAPWQAWVRRRRPAEEMGGWPFFWDRLRRLSRPRSAAGRWAAPSGPFAAVMGRARQAVNLRLLRRHPDWVWPCGMGEPVAGGGAARAPTTPVGGPNRAIPAVVDDHGLVVPGEDQWSLDWWFVGDDGGVLHPSRVLAVEQRLELAAGPETVTRVRREGVGLETRARVDVEEAGPVLRLGARVESPREGWLVLAVRPAHPDGVGFVSRIQLEAEALNVNRQPPLRLERADRLAASVGREGDVAQHLLEPVQPGAQVWCPLGLATGAALYRVRAGEAREVGVWQRLGRTGRRPRVPRVARVAGRERLSWGDVLGEAPRLVVPAPRWVFLHEAALRRVLVGRGRRADWAREARLIPALMAIGQGERAAEMLRGWPRLQQTGGGFRDPATGRVGNGEVLWVADRWERAAARLLPAPVWRAMQEAAGWLVRHHRGRERAERLSEGLWGAAGLRAAAAMAARRGEPATAGRWRAEAARLTAAMTVELPALVETVRRRVEAETPGAMEALAGDYPLQLPDFGGELFGRLALAVRHRALAEVAADPGGALRVAQTLLRADEGAYLALADAAAGTASATGQWPERGAPRGAPGSVRAAAEWVLLVRALFVREEADHLVIGAGVPRRWFERAGELRYGPTVTAWGPVTVAFSRASGAWRFVVTGRWYGRAPRVRVAVRGFREKWCEVGTGERPLLPL